MWVKIIIMLVYYMLLLVIYISTVYCHLPSYMSTPSDAVFFLMMASKSSIRATANVPYPLQNPDSPNNTNGQILNTTAKVQLHKIAFEYCVHDTIPICGQMGDEKRTFLDLCDLLEYACDTDQIFNHVDDTNDCPIIKEQH